MGICVQDKYPASEYFSISSISKQVMQRYGINLTIANLKAIAKKSKPYGWVITGSDMIMGKSRYTKVYRYADFVNKN